MEHCREPSLGEQGGSVGFPFPRTGSIEGVYMWDINHEDGSAHTLRDLPERADVMFVAMQTLGMSDSFS